MKSIKRFYAHKRDYDFADFDTRKGKKFIKKRSHKRLRKQDVLGVGQKAKFIKE